MLEDLEEFESRGLIILAMPINELRSITIFAKIAELGSLRKAAEAQNMTPTRLPHTRAAHFAVPPPDA